MANPTIGRVKCPITNEWAEVRKYSKGTMKLYLVSRAGMITPNSEVGQEWMLENAEIWGEGGTPPKEAKPVNEVKAKKAAVIDQNPVNEPKPVTEKPKRKTFLEMLLSEDDE